MDEVKLYHAVTECRRLHEEGMTLPAAAADAAERFGLHPLHVSEQAARAIKACRDARDKAGPEPLG